MLQVKIIDISLTKAGFVLFLSEKEGEVVLPVVIGISEAHSITLALNNISPDRPLSHDLFKTILAHVDISVVKVIISRLNENTFFADIYLKTMDGAQIVDARPSDAIALALRYKAPIYIAKEVMDSAGEMPKENKDDKKNTAKHIEAQLTEMEKLEGKLTEAVSREAYEEAALIRDQINSLKSTN